MLKYYIFCLSFFIMSSSWCQVSQSLFDIIDEHSTSGVILHGSIEELVSDSRSQKKNNGFIEFNHIEKGRIKLPIEMELRGRYRRIKCDFPPLKVDLKKSAASRQNLDNKFKSLRIITHCYEDDQGGYDHVEREYLVYKMYQLISPHSYRVKKVNIEYRDSISNTSDRYIAILIEDNDQLAFRLGAYECKDIYNLDDSLLDSINLLHVSGFQFMIANSDWDRAKLKNVRLFKRGDDFILVPYDFDFAAIVGSKMAIPNNNLGLFRIKDRCWTGPDLISNQPLKDHFQLKRKALEQLVNNAEMLSISAKNDMLEILASYFDIINADPLKNLNIYPSN